VCAAGVGGDSLHTEDVSDEEWERVHAINLNGVFYANRAAVPKMKANGYGRIVNIASIAGKEGNPMATAYSSSKAAVIGLTKAIGKDVAGSGILVNCIAPAVIDTPLLGQITEEHISYMTSRIPLGRMGRTDEVASLICWLASEEMSFSTAACFDISGGRATY
jgi:3-oxoacyl-[acyl-carrier protein] reductase